MDKDPFVIRKKGCVFKNIRIHVDVALHLLRKLITLSLHISGLQRIDTLIMNIDMEEICQSCVLMRKKYNN